MKAALTVCWLACAAVGLAQEPGRRAPGERWSAVLADPKAVIDPDEVAGLVEYDLQSPEPALRRVTLEAIATRIGLMRFATGPNTSLPRSPLRTALIALRPTVAARLNDQDEGVRHAAVEALGALGRGGTGRAPTLDRDTQLLLVGAFAAEPSPSVRAHMLKISVDAEPADAALDRQLITAGLAVNDSVVLQQALRGAGERKLSGAPLKRVVALVVDGPPDVQGAAARALGRYGEAARPELAALRASRGKQTNPEVRGVLDRLVQKLDASRAAAR
jgi:hypothetical protein